MKNDEKSKDLLVQTLPYIEAPYKHRLHMCVG